MVAGMQYYCCVKATLGVANHHPEMKSTPPKFFTALFFYPAGPIWAIYNHDIRNPHSQPS
jgi:hypothetical protein